MPAGVMLLCAVAYTAISVVAPGPLRSHLFNYYNYLADAFLHGSLSLVEPPPHVHDLSEYQGRFYLYWGPLPAIVLMPVVALVGPHWPDHIFSIALGVLASALVYRLLEVTQSLHQLSASKRFLLTLTFAFGSPVVHLASSGTVWFVGQLVSVVLMLSSLVLFLDTSGSRWRTAEAALCMALACAARPSVTGGVVWLCAAIAFKFTGRSSGHEAGRGQRAAVALALCAGVAILLGAYNFARFGSPLETGISFHRAGTEFQSDIAQHGLFALFYAPRNLFYHYLAYPFLFGGDHRMGASLFLMTPLYIGAFFAFGVRDHRRLVLSMVGTIVLIALPSLLVCGTGYVQVGPRYTLDYAPFLLILVALGIRGWPTWLVVGCCAVSIFNYLYGLALL